MGQAIDDQKTILKYLYERLAGGDARYCTIPTIRKKTEIDASNQYILALTDDLETAGYAITRQAYQMAGGRLFQITGAGIDLIDSGGSPNRADSADWTGRLNLSTHQIAEIQKILQEMKKVVSGAKLSNARTANAMALIESAEKLIQTPDPMWPVLMRLLRTPELAGVTGVAGLVFTVIQILIAAASN
ncbi:unnamed protein product [Ectocarpus sp. 12 AP-2014]